MKAIILAAGRSSRLYPITLEKPKCLLELEPGKTVIEHQLQVLEGCGIKDIIVVVGYLKEKIKDLLNGRVAFREFGDFAKYNHMHTFYSVRDDLDDDVIILFADVVFGKKLLMKCVESKEDFCLLVHNKNVLEGTMRVKIKGEEIVDIGNHIPVEKGDGNFIGVAKFSKKGASILVHEMEKIISDPKHDDDYYTFPLIEVAKKNKVGFEFVGDEPWVEMDFLEDYKKAKNKIYPSVK